MDTTTTSSSSITITTSNSNTTVVVSDVSKPTELNPFASNTVAECFQAIKYLVLEYSSTLVL